MRKNKILDRVKTLSESVSDWQLLKGSALISLGTIIARILGFAFSIVLASVFLPGDYGAIQYSIAVASVVGIICQPTGQHVLARFIGKYYQDEEKLEQIVAHIVILLAVFFLLTLIIAAPILQLVNQLSIGVLVIFLGETLFYAYWGLASGTQNANRLTAIYLGSNLIQLILVFLVFNVFGSRSTMLALVIYGSSYLLPLFILQKYFPLPVKITLSVKFSRESFIEILKFFFPKLISHGSFLANRSLDIFLLEYFSTPEELGAYLLNRTIVTFFLFIPRGISSLLMPKIASADDSDARKILNQMLVISLVINLTIFAFYIVLYDWTISNVFGADYKLDQITYIILGLTAIILGVYDLVNSYSVGKGIPAIETYGYLISTLIILVVGYFLVPTMNSLGIAIAKAIGVAASFIPFFFAQRKIRLKNKETKESI